MALGKLTERIGRLEEVSDQNAGAFIDTIKALEVQVNVLRGVIEELFQQHHGIALLTRPTETDGRIDWATRTREYLVELAKREETAERGLVPAPAPTDEQVVVFGGGE